MIIEDLGNLGDLIATFATVVTLVYLAQQIRRNAKSVEGASGQALMKQPGFQEMWSEIKIAYSTEFRQHLDEIEKIVEEAETADDT